MNFVFPWKRQPRTAAEEFTAGIEAEGNKDTQRAIECYRRALALDPAHVEARAALGRLRFAPPLTPVLDRTRQMAGPPVAEVMIEIRNPCNFRCFYCVAKGHNNEPAQPLDIDKIAQHYEPLKNQPIITVFECGGGEPTVHPQFRELVQMCASFGLVSFPTNNSQDPRRWLPRDAASRLYVRSTLHPEAEEKLERYIKHARTIIESGATFSGQFVAHPTRIASIPRLRELFAKHEINFHVIWFLGEHEGKSYPHAYTEEEKKATGLTDNPDTHWYRLIQPKVNRIRNFRGIPCHSGHRALYITGRGTLRRCTYDLRPLDNVLGSPEPCGVKKCGCGLYLEKLNQLDTGDTFQFWQKLVEPSATQRNLREAADGGDWQVLVAQEQAAMYDALMFAYGKDESPEP